MSKFIFIVGSAFWLDNSCCDLIQCGLMSFLQIQIIFLCTHHVTEISHQCKKFNNMNLTSLFIENLPLSSLSSHILPQKKKWPIIHFGFWYLPKSSVNISISIICSMLLQIYSPICSFIRTIFSKWHCVSSTDICPWLCQWTNGNGENDHILWIMTTCVVVKEKMSHRHFQDFQSKQLKDRLTTNSTKEIE